MTLHATNKLESEAPVMLLRNLDSSKKKRRLSHFLSSVRRLSVILAISSLALIVNLTVSLCAQANAPVTDLPRLEREVAETLSYLRQHPEVLVQDLKALLAHPRTDNGWGSYLLPSGAPISSPPDYLKASIAEAKIQPKLNALGWSDSLAQVVRAWAPQMAKNNALGHGNTAERYKMINAVTSEAIGFTHSSQTGEFDPKALIYTFWISVNEWTIGSAYDPHSDKAQRGHRGIVNSPSMTAVGVGCTLTPTDPALALCVIGLGKVLPDQGQPLMAIGSVSAAPAINASSASASTKLIYTQPITFQRGDSYDDGKHYLMLQTDGNFVAKTMSNDFVYGFNEFMGADKYGNIAEVRFQADGNLAAYDANGGYIWSAMHKANPGGKLALQMNGDLFLLNAQGNTEWAFSWKK